MQAFRDQITERTDFAGALRELGSQPGVSQALVDQVANASKQVGPAAAAEIARGLAGTEGLPAVLSQELATLFGESGAVGSIFADAFYSEGINAANNQLQGMKETIAKSEKKLRKLGRKIGEPIADELKKSIKAAIAAATAAATATAASYTPTARVAAQAGAPQLQRSGATQPVFTPRSLGANITINTGVGDPVAIAREIRMILNQGASRVGVS